MPLSLPSPSDDYAAPTLARLNKAFWDAALTSIGARLRALEALKTTWEDLIAQGTDQALEVIAANIEPQLAVLTASINQLKADVAAAEDAIAVIVAGGVTMSNVAGLSTALALLAPRDSPVFTGTPEVPTPSITADSAQIVNVTALRLAISNLLGGAGSAFDTLKELETALGDDANFAATVTAALAGKQASNSFLTALATLGASLTPGDLIQSTGPNAVQRVPGSSVGSVNDIAMLAMEVTDLRNSTVLAAGWWSESYDTLSTFNSGASIGQDTSEAGALKPTPPGIDSNVKLMLHGDGPNNSTTFTDSSLSPKTVTVGGGAKISTTWSKFGGASMYFNGASWASIPNGSDFAFGTGDFCVEARIYLNPVGGSLVGCYAGAAGGWVLQFAPGWVRWNYGETTIVTATYSFAVNTEYHVAVARVSGTLRIFINGAIVGSASDATNYSYTGSAIQIGRIDPSNGQYITGYVDELRICKGYGLSAAFTPPSSAYSAQVWNVDLRFVPQDIGVVPDTLDIYAAVQQVDTLSWGTDFMVYGTRNNAATWTQSGTISVIGTVGGATIIKATVAVSAQSSGQLVAPRFVSANNKSFKLLGHFIAGRV